MVTINVFLKVKVECRREYLKLVGALVRESITEEGCYLSIHAEDVNQPNEFVIIENWASQEAVASHNKTAHFQTFSNEINQYVLEDVGIRLS